MAHLFISILKFVYVFVFKPHSVGSHISTAHRISLQYFALTEARKQKKEPFKENANWHFKHKAAQSLSFHPSSSGSLEDRAMLQPDVAFINL